MTNSNLRVTHIFSDDLVSDIHRVLDESESVEDFFAEVDRLVIESELIELNDALEFEDWISVEDEKTGRASKIVYEGVGVASRVAGADPRLWTFLALVTFRDFMMERWNPHSVRRWKNRIAQRWLIRQPGREILVRNGISRLWWAAELTFADEPIEVPDPKFSGDYGLCGWLFEIEDRAVNLLEREIGSNPRLLRHTISALMRDKRTDRGKAVKEVTKNIRLESAIRDIDSVEDPIALVSSFVVTEGSH